MTEFREGDRVAVEGTVWYLDRDGMPTVVFRTGRGGTVEVSAADVTLLERPAPPLPTEPGTTGTAIIKGQHVRVVRIESGKTVYVWLSLRPIAGAWHHRDSDLSDFVPDPDTTTRCEASPISAHSYGDSCTCTRNTAGHIVAHDPECPLLQPSVGSGNRAPEAGQADDSPSRVALQNIVNVLGPDVICQCPHDADCGLPEEAYEALSIARAALADPQDVGRESAAGQDDTSGLRIENGWLVREVEYHTCGAGDGPYGHEPSCGLIPEVDLAALPGWPQPTPEPPQTDLCECGHERGTHTATGPVSNCRVGADSPRLADECTCLIYRPAPSAEAGS